MSNIIQLRKDTLENWLKYDPVLADGEQVLVATDSTQPKVYNSRKVGDGVSKFSALPMLGFDCLQETGDNTLMPMSQDAATRAINAVDKKMPTVFDESLKKRTAENLDDDPEKLINVEVFKGSITSEITDDTDKVPSGRAISDTLLTKTNRLLDYKFEEALITVNNELLTYPGNWRSCHKIEVMKGDRVIYKGYVPNLSPDYAYCIITNKRGDVLDSKAGVLGGTTLDIDYEMPEDGYVSMTFNRNSRQAYILTSSTGLYNKLDDKITDLEKSYRNYTNVLLYMTPHVGAIRQDNTPYHFDSNWRYFHNIPVSKGDRVLYSGSCNGLTADLASYCIITSLDGRELLNDRGTGATKDLNIDFEMSEDGYVSISFLSGSTIPFLLCKNAISCFKDLNGSIGGNIGYYVNPLSTGLPQIKKTAANGYGVTNFLKIRDLSGTIDVRTCDTGSESQFRYCFGGIYDKDRNPIGILTKDKNSTFTYDTDELKKDLDDLGLTENAGYVVFTIQGSKSVAGKASSTIPAIAEMVENSTVSIDIYDYKTVLRAPRKEVIAAVETASAGRCTALYDDDGYPSLMYKIPLVSTGALESRLGDYDTPHPAFIVNKTVYKVIYISMFMACEYEGHLVSWFGLTPVGSVPLNEFKSRIRAKGSRWHMETIYERSLLVMLARKYNSPHMRGNTNWGRSSAEGYEHECAQMENGKLPGQNNQYNGAKWIMGTQPSSWSHNKEAWGIQDVVGGYHEMCDLVEKRNGFIYLQDDNNFNADSASYQNTGVAYDYDSEKKVIMFNTQVTTSKPGETRQHRNQAICSREYDRLDEKLRKKLTLLLLVPRLSSEDEQPVCEMDGYIVNQFSNTEVPIADYVFGGAEEYDYSGLGDYRVAYDFKNSSHNNIGTRLCYIS